MVSDERNSYKPFIAMCCLIKNLKTDCQLLLKSVAKQGQSLLHEDLYKLVNKLQDVDNEEIMIRLSPVLGITHVNKWLDKINTQRNQPSFNHCDTEIQHDTLLAMDDIVKPNNFDITMDLFKEANIDISACQASVVKHAVAQCLKESRTLWRVGAGMGKSHMIALVTTLLVNLKPDSNIYVVYSNQGLLDKDDPLMNVVSYITAVGKRLKKCTP